MDNDNILKFMSFSSEHITNINRALKNIKSNTLADLIWINHQGFIIITNKATLMSNLSTIKNYTKNINNIEPNDIMSLHLFQSKPYLKIIGIFYLVENTNILINSSIAKTIIKNTYIFNDVLLASKS